MHNSLKNLDIPPIWLAATIALAWAIGRYDPWQLSFGGWHKLPAGLAICAGLVLMVLALAEMRKAQTTFWPHGQPSALVQSGIFTRSRNPIYLGDALVLLGAILWLDVPLALPLLPLLVWWIARRFIEGEEDRLRRSFGAEFARYCDETGRWFTPHGGAK